LGFAAALWVAVLVLRAFTARLAPGRDPLSKGLAIGAMSGVVALLLHSFFDFNLRLPSNALVFAVLLGLASSSRSPAPVHGYGHAPLAGALLCMSCVCGWRAAGAAAFERADRLVEPNARIGALDAVTRWHPYLPEAWRARGVAWRELGTPSSPLRSARLSWAEKDLSAALALRPQWAEALADRGWVRAMRGDLKGADLDLGLALRLDPSHAGIQRVAEEFARRRGVQR
jgi:hypothetical protein